MKKLILITLLFIPFFVIGQINTSFTLNQLDNKTYRVSEDKFKESSFIYSKKKGSSTYNYLSFSEGTVTMRFVASYYGDDWIFMDKIIFIIDDTYKYTIYVDPKRSVKSGAKVFEKSDSVMSEEFINYLTQIKLDSKVEIRQSGDKHSDYTLTKKAKTGIINIIKLYNKMRT